MSRLVGVVDAPFVAFHLHQHHGCRLEGILRSLRSVIPPHPPLLLENTTWSLQRVRRLCQSLVFLFFSPSSPKFSLLWTRFIDEALPTST